MATLTSILQGVQTCLTANLFTSNNCFYALEPDSTLDFIPNDQYCVITPAPLQVVDKAWGKQNNTTHASNVVYLWVWNIDVTVFNRLALDESNRDDSWLLDANLGVLDLTDSIINALQNFVITENHETFGYELKQVRFSVKKRETNGWGKVIISFCSDWSSRSQDP